MAERGAAGHEHSVGEAPDPATYAADAAAVRAWWRRHDLPGLFDVHVHFMAPPIQRAVWEVFDLAEHHPKLGRPWPIRYRWPEQDRVALLREMGVRRFSGLAYAHKPGVASFLNDWSRDFAARVPESIRSATFYPEPGVEEYVGDLIEEGVELFKVHVQVGEFRLDDPLLEPVWGRLAEAGTPVVIHCGSGPLPNAYTGPEPLARVLARHPRLTAVVAHLGAPEYAEFFALAARYERVHLDTTMVFTDFWSDIDAFPTELRPQLVDLADRILLGTDFPTIPYAYGHQLEALERLGLGDEWLRQVCWDNGVRLLGAEPRSAPTGETGS